MTSILFSGLLRRMLLSGPQCFRENWWNTTRSRANDSRMRDCMLPDGSRLKKNTPLLFYHVFLRFRWFPVQGSGQVSEGCRVQISYGAGFRSRSVSGQVLNGLGNSVPGFRSGSGTVPVQGGEDNSDENLSISRFHPNYLLLPIPSLGWGPAVTTVISRRLEFISDRSIIWHVFWRIFWHSFWHIFWHSFWHIFWHSFLTFLLTFFSDVSSDILSGMGYRLLTWHIFWHSFLTCLLTFFLTCLLASFLIYLLTFFQQYLPTFFLAYLLA